ncbi:MAG: chemotaxis protein CheB [Acidobacteriota bacterium]
MKPEIIVVGASLGGLRALQTVLKALPRLFPVPVVIVQHRDKDARDTLAGLLAESTPLSVVEPDDKERIEPGRVYLAAPDYHLLIDRDHFALSTDAPILFARPSIDLLFESAAEVYAQRAVGVILTGANSDGARGLAAIKERGGLTIVQDPTTADARAMPDAAIATRSVDMILPLAEIGPVLAKLGRVVGQDALWVRGRKGRRT